MRFLLWYVNHTLMAFKVGLSEIGDMHPSMWLSCLYPAHRLGLP